MPPISSPAHADAQAIRDLVAAHERLTDQIGKVVVGQKAVIEQLLMALLGGGHCLMSGVPGVAKTLLVGTLARVTQLSSRRVQFTPDLTPAELVGADTIQDEPETARRRSVFQPGPLFANAVLADGINRAAQKTQAALLEAMQEEYVTAGSQTYRLPEPFFVVATQSPIEQKGIVPLSPDQLDRFMFTIRVEYPTRTEEIQIMKATTGMQKIELTPVLDGKQVTRFQDVVRQVVVADHVFAFAADLVRSTRPKEPHVPKFVPELVAWGAGPRAGQYLILGGKARAVLHGRVHVTTEDIRAVALPVLRHRVMPTFHADAHGITPDAIVQKLLDAVPIPSENGPRGKK